MRVNLPVTGKEHPFPTGQILVSVTDVKGRITYCNPGFVKVSGYSAEELLGQPHNIVRHPDMPEEAFRDLWATIESGQPWAGVVKNRRKNGDHYWVQANAAPMVDGERIVGYLSVRTEADRASIEAAERLYARMSAEVRAGRVRTGLHHGRVVRRDPLGRLLDALRPRQRGQLALVQAAVAGAGFAAAFFLPWAVALPLAATAAAAGVWVTTRLTVAPWRKVLAQANRVAAGDLTYVVDTDGHGLVWGMQRALRQLSLNLLTSLTDFRTEVENLRGVAQEIAAGNHDLSARTEAQASSLEQTAASMEQINGSAKQSAASAAQGTQLAEETASIAHRSHDAVENVAKAMASINESSSRIGEIIHVIEGVAFQTNILALNAAVEAARAGEAGRGFAVVAAEVRALAQRTTGAAREIRQLIQESTERVAAGAAQSEEARQRMDEALAAVGSVGSLLGEISTAAHEQQAGIGQISDAVTHMDSITQQNAAMVEQLAASAAAMVGNVQAVMTTMGLFRLRSGDRTAAELDAVALRREVKSAATAAAGVAAATDAADGHFDFSQAVAKHAEWKTRLRNAALRGETMDVATIARDDCCPIGQWLHGPGVRRWGQKPSFVTLLATHRDFHQVAAEVAKKVNAKQAAEAQRMLEPGTPFAKATSAVVSAIRDLAQDIGDAATAARPVGTPPARKPAVSTAFAPRVAAKPVAAHAADDDWETF